MQKESLICFPFSDSITSSAFFSNGPIYNWSSGMEQSNKTSNKTATTKINFTHMGLNLIKGRDTQERTEHKREIQP